MTGRRWARRGVVVLLAALVTFTGWLHNQRAEHPPQHDRAATGSLGEDVRAYPLVAHASAVRTSPLLAIEDFDGERLLDTGGLWVVVTLSYAGIDTPAQPRGVELQDAYGRTFSQSDRVDWLFAEAQPDGFVRLDVVFEVPAGSLDGDLVLRVITSTEDRVPVWVAEIGLGAIDANSGDPIVPAEAEFLDPGER